ncbi:MAG: alpha/beta hydrolase [Hyphomonadaceae bacterium]|nr:alpha/beta hydrolase [Hyphomonadaceae bacterium]
MAGFRRVSFEVPQGRMAGLAWGDDTRPYEIVFLHATGFNALTYAEMLAPLGERFHVLALDARGHGRTELPTRRFGYTSWNRHRDDLIAVLDKLPASATLAGHSMGATVSLLVAGKRPDLVRSLALLEPVILAPGRYSTLELPGMPYLMRHFFPIARQAARRRASFLSRDVAAEQLRGRGFFKGFSEETLRNYLEDGLVDEPGGGVRLACSPAWEAATFAGQRHDPWGALMRAPKTIVILRAEKDSSLAPSVAERIKMLRPDVRLATVEGATHALPMERPDRARAAIETAAMTATRGAFADIA